METLYITDCEEEGTPSVRDVCIGVCDNWKTK